MTITQAQSVACPTCHAHHRVPRPSQPIRKDEAADTITQAQTVACPTCHAHRGRNCTSPAGTLAPGWSHPSRVVLADPDITEIPRHPLTGIEMEVGLNGRWHHPGTVHGARHIGVRAG